jgi:hypothetical protein
MKKPFKFLNPAEFAALTGKERDTYLNTAAQELEMRQRELREQAQQRLKEKPDLKEQ